MSATKQEPQQTGAASADANMPTNKGKARQPTNTANARASGVMSFVSFDVNSSEEARKAVRKQAALASAATRKATIARKMAQQKAGEQQKEDDKTGIVKPASRKAVKSPQQSNIVHGDCGPEQDRELTKGVTERKRKRESETAWPSSWNVHTTAVSRSSDGRIADADVDDTRLAKKQIMRAVSGYLSPVHSVIEDESDDPLSSTHSTRPGYTVDGLSPISMEDPASTSLSALEQDDTLWRTSGWPAFLRDYRNHKRVIEASPPIHATRGPHSLADSKVDPFNLYPVEYHPIFDKLLHHMVTVFAPRGWPTLKITTAEGHEWEQWMTQQSLAEPAFFFVRLLFASGDLIRLKQLDPKVADWLRSLAIKEINDALSDPTRSISDGLILAVGRIALTESLYGDRAAASSIHRPAQKRMIDLRGGMNALGFPALVKKLMRWADNMMAIQSGTPRILDDAEETESEFGTKQGVKVLEKWVPNEGKALRKALRKKITISDLIT